MHFVHPCGNNIVKQRIGLAFVEIIQGVRKVENEEFFWNSSEIIIPIPNVCFNHQRNYTKIKWFIKIFRKRFIDCKVFFFSWNTTSLLQ